MVIMDLKGITWVGHVYQKFEAMCLEAEEIMYQSFVVALLAMVIATFSTGIDSQCFQLQFSKKEARAEDTVPYGYGFFHFVFATGAMYFAMLLIGWNTHHTIKRWTIDVGWTSTWVRIVNEWLAVCVYCKYLTRTRLRNRICISMELVTAVLGDHGQRPREDYG
ncbi:hypothetical protein PVK06_016812 [Gossypium arboreum]|uniref:Serine incorporator n=1 Tax=Gossypium arboreum TaxID=29729 RepID=A0ABR0Q248_GOSAR|nr:hypothetical protein PVK06_016812 [Gossypium arboreum]